jgi:hypothetical protein
MYMQEKSETSGRHNISSHNIKRRKYDGTFIELNPLTPELNPSAQSYLTRFFTGDFAS